MDTIRLFCDVARLRSFSKAGELHGITQSAVSQRIRGLEDELGVQLIDRTRRPPRLTAAGGTYYRGCRQILERYDELRARLTNGRVPLRGQVTIAAIYSADMALLAQMRSAFRRLHPGAQVRIQYYHPDDVCDRVRHREYDFGIVSYPERLRDLTSIPLRQEVMVVVCAAGHPLASLSRAEPADLRGQPLVGFDAHLPISREIVAYLKRHGVQPEVASSFDNIDTIKAAVAGTETVALLPERTVRNEVRLGVLASIPLEPTLIRPVGIVHARGQEFSPLVQSCIDFLVTYEPSGPNAPLERTPASLSA